MKNLLSLLSLCLLMLSCSTKSTEVRGVCGTLDGPTTGMSLPDLSEIQGDQWLTADVMHGTGVHVEQLYQIAYHKDSIYVTESIDPYDVQQAFCQRLGYTIEGEQITLYLDREPLTIVTNTVTDMGGFDDDAIWVGEQIRYDLSGEKPRVCITPGMKFVVGLMLHYDDMPTFTASITKSDGIINLLDIKIEKPGWSKTTSTKEALSGVSNRNNSVLSAKTNDYQGQIRDNVIKKIL